MQTQRGEKERGEETESSRGDRNTGTGTQARAHYQSCQTPVCEGEENLLIFRVTCRQRKRESGSQTWWVIIRSLPLTGRCFMFQPYPWAKTLLSFLPLSLSLCRSPLSHFHLSSTSICISLPQPVLASRSLSLQLIALVQPILEGFHSRRSSSPFPLVSFPVRDVCH